MLDRLQVNTPSEIYQKLQILISKLLGLPPRGKIEDGIESIYAPIEYNSLCDITIDVCNHPNRQLAVLSGHQMGANLVFRH